MSPGQAEVDRLRRRLRSTLDRVESVPEEDPQIRADFAKYACVLVSGYFERAVVELLLSFTQMRSEERVSRRVRKWLEFFQNPKKGRLLELVDGFDPDWRQELDDFIDERRAAAIGTIVAQRHRIAHGEDSNISFHQVREYLEPIDEVVGKLAELTS